MGGNRLPRLSGRRSRGFSRLHGTTLTPQEVHFPQASDNLVPIGDGLGFQLLLSSSDISSTASE